MKLIFCISLLFVNCYARAKDLNATISKTKFADARHESLSGADLSISDGISALNSNPAFTGGSFKSMNKDTFKRFSFPYFGANILGSQDSVSSSLFSNPTFDTNKFAEDLTSKQEPAYSRTSIVSAVGIARFIIAGYYDNQTSLAKWDSDNTFNVARQENIGAMLSFSMLNKNKNFFFGGSLTWINQSLLKGNASAISLQDETLFSAFKKDNTNNFEAYSASLGMSYTYRNALMPTISINMDDVGTTLYNNQDDSSLVGSYVIKENLEAAISILPRLGKWGNLSWILQFDHLTDSEIDFSDKYRTGIDLNFGMGFASESTADVSAGYSSAGVSAGAGCRFLFFNLRAALVPIVFETADGEQRESYYRQSFSVDVNLARGL